MSEASNRRHACIVVAILCACAFFAIYANHAKATEITEGDINELQAKVEESSATYNAAVANVAALDASIAENTARQKELEAALPVQQEKFDTAIRSMYIYQQDNRFLLSLILRASSFQDMLSSIEYLERMQDANIDVINDTISMKTELASTAKELETERIQAVQEQELAATSLQQAQASREEAMRQAAEQAAAEAAAAAEAQNEEVASSPPVSFEDVNWSDSKEAFVNEWTGRIDSYLSGSPLEGQGRAFAVAAWDYGVDPRWSPAISNVESSKGAVCFRSYNAWGWGTKSWNSWEEAIDAHVSGLARIYGSTITYSSAQKYCPSNPDHWYSATLNQMNSI